MKKTTTIFLLSIWSFLFASIGTQVNGQVAITTHNTSVNTNFNGWNGTMPNGFSRSANNNYMGTAPTTSGGVYAIPNMGFGYQPSSNQSATTTSVTGTYVNNTGGTITELKITYDAFKIVHRDARNPCWTVNVSSGVFGTNLNWCSNQADATKTFTSVVSIPSGATFTVTFNSDRGTGSQSSPMIGFNNIKVESIQATCVTPDAPLVDPQFFCGGATVNDLFADGENIKWYASQDAMTALTSDILLQTATYYVTQTVNNCESDKVPVEISVQPAPEAPVAAAQSFCGTATVADLIAQGTNLNWYDSTNSTTPLTAATQLQTGTYYVTQTANNCASPKTAVEITVNQIPSAPLAEAQSFCGSATVADLIPNVATDRSERFNRETELAELPAGQHNFDLQWTVVNRNVRHICDANAYEGCAVRLYNNFDPLKGSIKSPVFEGIQTISFYAKRGIQQNPTLRVSKIVNGVETVIQNINLTNVTEYTSFNIDINENEDAQIVFASQSGDVNLDNIKFNEAITINWYDVATEGTPLSADTALSTGIYYISKSRNGCESPRTPVEITVNEIPAAPVAEAQSFCGTATVGDLIPASAEGTPPLVEGFEADIPGSITGSAQFDLGMWTTQNIGTNNEPGNSISGYAARFNFFPTMISPEIDNIVSISFYGKATAAKTLNISKIVNGNESHLQTVTLQPGEMQLFTVNVNELSENVKIKFVGQDNFPTGYVDNVTFYQTNSSDENISWFATETSIDVLSNETPLETGTYYVSQTVNGCVSPRTAVEVTVNEIPAAPVAEAQTFCGTTTITDLVAEGTNLIWFETIDATEALTDETELTSGTYYVAQSANDCVSERTAVVIIVNEIPTVPTAEAQSFCGTATVADLVAEGTNLTWFDSIDSTEELTADTELTSGSYFVEQSANDCVSERTEVIVTINEIPTAPTAEAQSFCGTATVADLVAEGTNLTWFDSIDSIEELTAETELTSGSYFVAQSTDDCTSERTAVEITVNEIPNAPEAQDQSFCGEATVADLVAEGTNLAWYATENSTEELTADTELTSGTYYVAQSSETCESVRIPIEVTINEIPAAPIAFTLQEFEPGATLADLDVEGENLTWYDEEGNILDPSTPLVDGEIYYVSQTINGCESETIGIETEALNISESDFANFNLYPNPVKNILHISNTKQIDQVLVFNLSGQLILEKKANAKSVELNLSHLATATYVVKIVSNNQIKTVKVIKK